MMVVFEYGSLFKMFTIWKETFCLCLNKVAHLLGKSVEKLIGKSLSSEFPYCNASFKQIL